MHTDVESYLIFYANNQVLVDRLRHSAKLCINAHIRPISKTLLTKLRVPLEVAKSKIQA